MAFDFGLKRTGVAFGTILLQQATALPTIVAHTERRRFEAIAPLIHSWQPDALVIGVPRYPDGAVHDMTGRCERFARQLHGRFHLPVFTVDERYSSVEAQSAGVNDVDAGAATVILEQFLREYVNED
jgi:putative Holliday junction resolvase